LRFPVVGIFFAPSTIGISRAAYMPLRFAAGKRQPRRDFAPPKQFDAHEEFPKEETMRNLLVATVLGVGLLATGAATQQASAAPFNAGGIEVGAGVTEVQYYGGYYRRPYYAPPPPRYYAPRPRYYGYYAPPPRPRYYAPPRPYYRRW
jgi:hypothetical protein